ncbi:MAG: NADH-quinone oxidoreductase subunit NuoG [Actinomycetota bacterium]
MSDVPVSDVVKTTLSVTIDGKPHEARRGQLVIDACQDAGSYVPHFCYHPRMSSVGMCRQCFVEIDGPRGPMMVASCMTPVVEGQVVRTATDGIKRVQEGVLELLLVNHPLDCPVCDKGGECPLQDQAFSHGPGESRFVEEKRHFEKPIPISDLVYLDRERCILCDRCTRFADEVAGDPLITFTSRGSNTQVLTFPDEPFSSYFSGNTVQICPVGALTARPYRFKARPWDLDQEESTCTTCSVGCRTVIQSSRDELVRYQGVDIDPVNWGWLCDRGRFNFESVNSTERVTTPLIKSDTGLVETSWAVALDAAARILRTALALDPESVAIIGGARGTNEDAFAWAKLADALHINQRDSQLADGLPSEVFALPQATIDDINRATTIILLSPDLKEELPVLFLRVRHAAEKRTARVIEFSSHKTGMTKYAWRSTQSEGGKLASAIRRAGATSEIAEQLHRGDVVVLVGRMNLAESPEFVISALAEVLHLAPHARVLPTLRRGNVRGAITAGLTPQSGAGDTADILAAAGAGKIECLILLGADPLADVPDADLARRGLAGARSIISIDTFLTRSSAAADVVLPAAAYGEKIGTTTNLEGRISNVAQKITPAGTSRPDWMIAAELSMAVGHDLGISSYADVRQMMLDSIPAFAPARHEKRVRHDGVVMDHPHPVTLARSDSSVADHNSFKHRLVVSRKLYDGAQGTAKSPSLVSLAGSVGVYVHPLDRARVGVRDGVEVKVTSNRATLVLPLRESDDVMVGTAWIPFNQAGADVRELLDLSEDVCDVRIEHI